MICTSSGTTVKTVLGFSGNKKAGTVVLRPQEGTEISHLRNDILRNVSSPIYMLAEPKSV